MSKPQIGMGLEAAGMLVAIVGNIYVGQAGFAIMALGAGMSVAGGLLVKPGTIKPKSNNSGQLMNFRSSRQPVPLLYGELEAGCNKTFYHVANPYLHIICELGEGPIDGIKRADGSIWNTTATELPRTNPPLVYLDRKLWTEYVYTKNGEGGTPHYPVYIEFFNGSASQSVCASLQSASGGKWDQALRYTAYLYIRLEFNIDCFKQEPDVTAMLRGLKIYNPITTTTAWTNNPALQAYDMMTRSSQRGGIGVAANRIDLTALSGAIDYCTAKGWTCNLPITDQAAASDNLEQILDCFRGAVINSSSGFKMRFLDINYETSVLDLTEADVVSDSLHISADFKDRPNAVKATYLDPKNNFKSNDYVFTDPTAIAAEGDYREIAVDFLGLSDPGLVQKAANYALERARLQKNVGLVAHERAMGLEALDLIRLTNSRPGWNQKLMRVLAPTIGGSHTVTIALVDEALTLYDDIYNLTDQDYHDTTLIDPSADPPDVINGSIAEESYDFRLRAFTRLNVTFDPPADYPWFDHVEVWVSTDGGSIYRHQFNAKTNFSIDPVEEGAFYYIRLRTVNVFGRCQDESSAVTLARNVIGRSITVPESLSAIMAIVTSGALNVFGERVSDPDIELYEFRLGASWSGAVFLAAQRAPVLSLAGVRPGSHTIWANTLATNGLYGANPRSAGAVVSEPPDGWTVGSTQGPNGNLVVNGDMELNSNWSDYNGAANVQTSSQKKDGTYSRQFVVSGAGQGIQSDPFATVTGEKYSWSAWVRTDGATSVHVYIERGDIVTVVVDQAFSGLTPNAWNLIYGSYTEVGGGSAARIYFDSGAVTSGNWYIDNVCLIRGEVSGACAYMYNGDPCIRLTHEGGTLTGTWKSQIFDLSSSSRSLIYALSDVVVISGSSTWASIFPLGTETWASVIGSKSWAEVFAPTSSSQIRFKLKYGDGSPPTSEVERLEILCAIVTGRYFQLEATITDPNDSTYGMFESPTLKLCS